jgi:hypothetical protein
MAGAVTMVAAATLAAPTPAFLRKFLRFIYCFTPLRVSPFGWRDIATRKKAWKDSTPDAKNPAEAGLSTVPRGRP